MIRPDLLRRIGYSPLKLARKERRFVLAIEIARRISPFVHRVGGPTMPSFALGSYREFCTACLLQSITHAGIEFDPVIKIKGAEKIPTGASILVSGHFYLDFIFIRWVHDHIASPGVLLLTGLDEWRIQGTTRSMDVLLPGARSMLQVRKVLDSGRPVIGAIEYPQACGKEWTRTHLPQRELYVSTSLLTYAVRSQTPLFFFDTYFDDEGGVTAVVERITSPDPVIDYSRFLSQALERRETVQGSHVIAPEPVSELV